MGNELIEINIPSYEIEIVIHKIIDEKILFNDGKLDANGRFWVGSMDPKFSSPIGSLYCIDNSFKTIRKDDDIITSNGLGWSPNNKILYFTDTIKK